MVVFLDFVDGVVFGEVVARESGDENFVGAPALHHEVEVDVGYCTKGRAVILRNCWGPMVFEIVEVRFFY